MGVADAVYDEITLTIEHTSGTTDDGEFYLAIQDPDSGDTYSTDMIEASSGSISNFRGPIKAFYWKYYYAYTEGTLVMYDINGDVTESNSEAIKYVCTVRSTRLISTKSTTRITVV